MVTAIRIGVAGALGRMGRQMIALIEARDGLEAAARFDRPDLTGEGLTTLEAALASCDVIVDFTVSSASATLAARAAAAGGPALVIGSTGWTPQEDSAVKAASARIAIVRASNFSLGVNVLAGLVAQASARLSAADWDIEIFEAHHRRKVDAPSGTALRLGEAAAAGRHVSLEATQVRARDGITGAREEGAIGFSVMRGGGIFGEHKVVFAAEEEVLTLSHTALDRAVFARGALEAAIWVKGRPSGLYDMMDVLGFKT